MSDFRFYHPIEVRYGDLDPQGHVNNAKHLTYFEQARVQYWVDLGLFRKDQSFMEIGVIVADIHITYHAPILWGTPLKVGVRISRIGNKSMTIEQSLENAETGEVHASGTVIAVAFDYAAQKTMSVPQEWREKINAFEQLEA
ncbi:MAG TPA: thioesterase family protein [Anaerolineales bacterium]|nr:thioesterase family protein [Anaerolineales bacterium]